MLAGAVIASVLIVCLYVCMFACAVPLLPWQYNGAVDRLPRAGHVCMKRESGAFALWRFFDVGGAVKARAAPATVSNGSGILHTQALKQNGIANRTAVIMRVPYH